MSITTMNLRLRCGGRFGDINSGMREKVNQNSLFIILLIRNMNSSQGFKSPLNSRSKGNQKNRRNL